MNICRVLLILILSYINGFTSCNIVNGNTYGDCSHIKFSNKSKDILRVSENKEETGIIDGAVILPGGNLYFSGISNGDIIVSKNSQLTITGICDTIKNNEGIVYIKGKVNNVVVNGGKTIISGVVSNLSGTGKIIYKKGAFVNNKLTN